MSQHVQLALFILGLAACAGGVFVWGEWWLKRQQALDRASASDSPTKQAEQMNNQGSGDN